MRESAAVRAVHRLRGENLPYGELRGNGSAALKLSFNTSERRRLFRGGRSHEPGRELIEFLIKMRSNCSGGEGRIHEGGRKGMNNEIVIVCARMYTWKERVQTWRAMRHAVGRDAVVGGRAGGFIDRQFITWI